MRTLISFRSLLAIPIVAAAVVALVLVAPILVVGEASDNEARAQARSQMFAAGAGVATEGVRAIDRYFGLVRRELLAIAAGDVRQAVASRDPDALISATDRASVSVGGTVASPTATRIAITDGTGSLLMQEDPRDCRPGGTLYQRGVTCFEIAAQLAQQIRGRTDPRAVAMLSGPNVGSRSQLSDPYLSTARDVSRTAVTIGTLITRDDSSLAPIGMLLADVPIADAIYAQIAGLMDRAEDVYVIDRTGRYVLGGRERGVAPLTDLTSSAVVATALRSQPRDSSLPGAPNVYLAPTGDLGRAPTGSATLKREDAADPFTGATRPIVTSVLPRLSAVGMTSCDCSGDRIDPADKFGWLILVVPDQTPVRSLEETLTQLRLARIGLGAVLVLGTFLLASGLRAVSRQRGALATANAALTQATQEVEAASRHKSEFLANMSHELRTPLNAVIGFADVLSQRMFGDLNERQTGYVGDIASSGRHLLDLVNDILDLSKVEAGRLELETSEFSPGETVRDALAFVRERAGRHGITLDADVPTGLGTVVADERKVRQVILNLLSNAVKFTPDGGAIHASASAADGDLRVSVRDSGIGIAPEDQAAVFEEFTQVGRPSDRSREGTGLGLTLAKRFVELHGGRIWLESEIGRGTTFTFTIPNGHATMTPAAA